MYATVNIARAKRERESALFHSCIFYVLDLNKNVFLTSNSVNSKMIIQSYLKFLIYYLNYSLRQ